MGSPAHDLKLSPRLRPWFGAGLTHLLVGHEVLSALSQSKDLSYRQSAPSPAMVSTTESTSASPTPQFPVPWDFFWSKTTPGAQVIFTYHHLGLDLTGKGNPKRGQLFREILQYLSWAGKGIVTFWPMSQPVNNALEHSISYFWQGLTHLGVEHVACFGADAFTALTSRDPVPNQVCKVNGVAFYWLPSPDELIGKLPHERHMAADGLKSIRLKT